MGGGGRTHAAPGGFEARVRIVIIFLSISVRPEFRSGRTCRAPARVFLRGRAGSPACRRETERRIDHENPGRGHRRSPVRPRRRMFSADIQFDPHERADPGVEQFRGGGADQRQHFRRIPKKIDAVGKAAMGANENSGRPRKLVFAFIGWIDKMAALRSGGGNKLESSR